MVKIILTSSDPKSVKETREFLKKRFVYAGKEIKARKVKIEDLHKIVFEDIGGYKNKKMRINKEYVLLEFQHFIIPRLSANANNLYSPILRNRKFLITVENGKIKTKIFEDFNEI